MTVSKLSLLKPMKISKDNLHVSHDSYMVINISIYTQITEAVYHYPVD